MVTSRDLAEGMCELLRVIESEQARLDQLDAIAGDGDHGATVVMGLRAVVASLPADPDVPRCGAAAPGRRALRLRGRLDGAALGDRKKSTKGRFRIMCRRAGSYPEWKHQAERCNQVKFTIETTLASTSARFISQMQSFNTQTSSAVNLNAPQLVNHTININRATESGNPQYPVNPTNYVVLA